MSPLADYGYSALNGNNGGNGCGLTHAGPVTFGILHTLAAEFLAIQLVFFNDTPDALHIGAASVAAAANTLGDPVDESGNPFPPRRVTFSNAGRDVDHATQLSDALQVAPSGALSLDMPAHPLVSVFNPALHYSDWTPLISVPRTDGGPGRLLHVRVATPEGHAIRTRLLNQAGGARPDPATGIFSAHFRTGRTFDCWKIPGDKVTDAPMGFPNTHDEPSSPLWAVRYLTPRGVLNVLVTGESVFQGYGSDSGTESFAVLGTCSAHTEAQPVELFCLAQGGEPSLNFAANAINALGHGRIGLTICPAWDGNNDLPGSPDWATAKAQIDAEWSAVMAMVSATRRHGSALALATPMPNCFGPWQEAARLFQSVRIRALAGRPDVTVVDMEALLGAMDPSPVFDPSALPPATSNTFRPDAQSADGIHPGQPGHERAAPAYAAIVRGILAG